MVDKIKIANIPVHLLTVDALHSSIGETIKNEEKKLFLHANARLVELANTKEIWLQDFFNTKVDYVMCDGSGIQLAAKLTQQPVPQKIAYNIWFYNFIEFASKENFSIYF